MNHTDHQFSLTRPHSDHHFSLAGAVLSALFPEEYPIKYIQEYSVPPFPRKCVSCNKESY